jgi:hypothetical protein
MRFRGETVAGIASQASVSQAKVRECLKVAAESGGNGRDEAAVDEPERGLRAVSTERGDGARGQDSLPAAVGAQ